ncbi:hypothetical protein KDW_55130 [Dictyobacter vulcani]|uniref:Uncharacterized protein n=1 Tax=Dictyobacter vulcani TaxID=2607529 RepID=A0A5J4KXW9_9CHLR|nr:hypothetical protein KDW_55130 [Dictyobacter vulcani]
MQHNISSLAPHRIYCRYKYYTTQKVVNYKISKIQEVLGASAWYHTQADRNWQAWFKDPTGNILSVIEAAE